MRQFALIVVAAASVVSIHSSAQAPSPPPKIDFVRDIQPIFRQNCYECHGPDKQMNGFRLDRRHVAFRGGTLPVINPGSSGSSRLYLRLIGTSYGHRMPLENDPLPAGQIEAIKAWLDQGAVWPDEASGDVAVAPLDAAAVSAFGVLREGHRAAFLAMVGDDPKLSTLRGPGGATPLMAAALYGDAALVKTLLDRGARPNVANDAGATPLMWAVTDLEKTRALVEHGANVNARSDDGRSPLLIAASIRGNRDVVSLLLDRGANPSGQGAGLIAAITAITEAAKQGDEATIRLLIERGSDVSRAGFAALGFAMRSRCDACAEMIAAKLPPALFSPAMAIAAPPLGPALATVSLLDRGADPNVRSPTGYPMLVLAAASEAMPVEAVKALIAHGADLRATTPYGETALAVARRHGHTPVVDALVQAGVTDTAPPAAPPPFSPAHSSREAVLRSLPLLQRADVTFLQKAGCVSCHNNAQTAETVALARKRGLPVDEATAAAQHAKAAAYLDDWRERAVLMQGIPGDADTMSALLNGVAAGGRPSDPTTDAVARFIRMQQAADGRWRAFAHRPPIESSDLKTTVESLRALQEYSAPGERTLADAAIGRAAAWLVEQQPEGSQDRAYLVLGLHATGAAKTAIAAAAQRLASLQRSDGGWAALPTLDSDAYATGEALVALLQTGAMRLDNPVIRHGLAFLLSTQLADGSWHVQRRAIPVQPYFDAGFPHGRDQFVSAAATNWAAQALIYAAAKKGT